MLASLVQASSIPPGREITSRLHTHTASRVPMNLLRLLQQEPLADGWAKAC